MLCYFNLGAVQTTDCDVSFSSLSLLLIAAEQCCMHLFFKHLVSLPGLLLLPLIALSIDELINDCSGRTLPTATAIRTQAIHRRDMLTSATQPSSISWSGALILLRVWVVTGLIQIILTPMYVTHLFSPFFIQSYQLDLGWPRDYRIRHFTRKYGRFP